MLKIPNGYFSICCCLQIPLAAIQKHTKTKKNAASTQSTHSTFTQSVHFPQASVHC